MKPTDYKARLDQSGKSQVTLAKFLGISKDSAHRLINGIRPPKGAEQELLERFLEGEVRKPEVAFEMIDVYGYAGAGGDDRVTIADDRVIDRIELPAGLVRTASFGIRVAGDSMEPRLFAGETVIVAKDLRPTRNGDCVLEFRDGTAIVKQYRGQSDGVVFLHQFNPAKEIRVDASSVRALHAVLYRR